MREKFKYFSIHSFFSLVVFFIINTLMLIWGAFSQISNDKKDYLNVFSLLFWILTFFFASFLFFKFTRIKWESFYYFFFRESIMVLILGGAILLIVRAISPDFLKFSLGKNYVGVYNEHEDIDADGRSFSKTAPLFVFHYKDSDKKKFLRDNDVQEANFLFWQTAYVKGYDISHIKSDLKHEKFVLFLVAGQLTLLETLINIGPLLLSYLIFFSIYLVFIKKVPYSSFKELKELLSK